MISSNVLPKHITVTSSNVNVISEHVAIEAPIRVKSAGQMNITDCPGE